MTLPLDLSLYLSAALFSIGVYGVLGRQNLIVILMSLELMLNAVNLALIAFGRAFFTTASSAAEASTPQIFVLIVLAVAAAEAAVGLSILLAVYRRWRTTNAGEINLLRG
jgi:NADH-quinone oxidoreductase subunit K